MSIRRKISSGAHYKRRGACAMEWVWLIRYGHVTRQRGEIHVDWVESKNDMPECTLPLISHLVIKINDSVDQRTRDGLAQLIPRILRARRGRTREENAELNNRLILRMAASLVSEDDPNRGVMLENLEIAERALVEGRTLQPSDVKLTGAERPLSLTFLVVERALREAMRVSQGDVLDFMTLSHTVHQAIDMMEPEDKVPFVELVLDLYDKLVAEMGLLGDDPEDDYIEDDVLEDLIKELSGGAQ